MIKHEFIIGPTHRFRFGFDVGSDWHRLDFHIELNLFFVSIWFSVWRSYR